MLLTPQARLGLLIVVCAGLWALEFLIPLFQNKGGRERLRSNVVLAMLLVGVNLILATGLALCASWVVEHRLGLLGLASLSDLSTAFAGLVGLDFFTYVAHVLLHKIPAGWSFHRVHHSDQQVDVTTALRQHPGETFWRIGWQLAGTAVFGIPFRAVAIYTTASSLTALCEHANLRIPAPLDRMLRWLIITPDMHKVHHSRAVAQADSNYGNIFSIWDRLFRTYRADGVIGLRYGVDGLDDRKDQTLAALLELPFRP